MAKAKTEAEYQEWVKEVSAKVPDEFKAGFDALTGSPVGMELFGGHLREKEFHRRLNEVHSERSALESQRQAFSQDVASMDEWFNEESPKNQRLMAERDKLRAEVAATRGRLNELGLEEDTPKVKSAGATTDEAVQREIQALKQRIQMMDQALPAMLADYGTVLRQNIQENSSVDPREVIAFSLKNSVPLPQAWDSLTYDERTKRAEKVQEDALVKAKEEGRREALSQRGSPDYLRPAGPSVIDTIQNSKPTLSQDRVAASVAEYYEIARA